MLVCVLCGRPWEGYHNRCECGGFCTWGESKGDEPMSWIKTEKGYIPKPVNYDASKGLPEGPTFTNATMEGRKPSK